MKKIITTSILTIAMMVATNAQITKPKVSVNTIKVDNGIDLKGLKVNNLKKFKTLADFEKVNIPVQQATKERLNKKPTRSWTINPKKLNDGSLKFDQFTGIMTQNNWTYGGANDLFLNMELERLNRGGGGDPMGSPSTWPIAIKFRVSGGIDYRLKFKNGFTPEIIENQYIYIYRGSKNGRYVSRINMNELYEFIYIFKEPNSCDVTIGFTAIPELKESHISSSRRNSHHWNWVSISEIRIDRLD